MNNWYFIINKYSGKKIDGGMYKLGGALAKHSKMLEMDATEDELKEYHNAETTRARRIELLEKWQARCTFKIVTKKEYCEMRK